MGSGDSPGRAGAAGRGVGTPPLVSTSSMCGTEGGEFDDEFDDAFDDGFSDFRFSELGDGGLSNSVNSSSSSKVSLGGVSSSDHVRVASDAAGASASDPASAASGDNRSDTRTDPLVRGRRTKRLKLSKSGKGRAGAAYSAGPVDATTVEAPAAADDDDFGFASGKDTSSVVKKRRAPLVEDTDSSGDEDGGLENGNNNGGIQKLGVRRESPSGKDISNSEGGGGVQKNTGTKVGGRYGEGEHEDHGEEVENEDLGKQDGGEHGCEEEERSSSERDDMFGFFSEEDSDEEEQEDDDDEECY